MLYDKRWDKPEVKADPFSMDRVVQWLETKPADETYCYVDGGACLIHQYLTHAGIPVDRVWSCGDYTARRGSPRIKTSRELWRVSANKPHTFGAALERARAALCS